MVALVFVSLIGAGIVFIGLRFLINPAAGATGFGVAVRPSDAYAHVSMAAVAAFLWHAGPA